MINWKEKPFLVFKQIHITFDKKKKFRKYLKKTIKLKSNLKQLKQI